VNQALPGFSVFMMYGALVELICSESDLFSPTMTKTWPNDGTVAAEAGLARTGLIASRHAARPERIRRRRMAAPPEDRNTRRRESSYPDTHAIKRANDPNDGGRLLRSHAG
jgi:hypothetical protein